MIPGYTPPQPKYKRGRQAGPGLTYGEKLKDPRWQKRRLQILERDEWACQSCFDTEATLHVHHRYYEKGAEPWDSPDGALITLCEECHDNESREMAQLLDGLGEELRRRFLAEEVCDIAEGFHSLTLVAQPGLVARAIGWALRHTDVQAGIVEAYLAWRAEQKERWAREHATAGDGA